MTIDTVPFKKESIEKLKEKNWGTNWPVVYILHGDNSVYIGETCDMAGRLYQHLEDPRRNSIKQVEIIHDYKFNKSVTLDIEQKLIRLFDSDDKYQDRQNRNGGQSASHEYYDRPTYESSISEIWDDLGKKEVTTRTPYTSLIRSELYKYSPYTSLNREQMNTYLDVLEDFRKTLEDGTNGNYMIVGGAGTGKTILALNLLRTLSEIHNQDSSNLLIDGCEDASVINELKKVVEREKKGDGLKIAFCVSMMSLRKTLKTVVKSSLGKNYVLGPSDIVNKYKEDKKEFDVVIIDESHRLKQRKNLGQLDPSFKNKNKDLNLDEKEGTQLDWIIKCSKYRILFYDSEQSIKGSDVESHVFESLQYRGKSILNTQMRCRGGSAFTKYIDDILNCRNPKKELSEKQQSECKFEFRMFDNIRDLSRLINQLETTHKLSRLVAGYSWKWETKKADIDRIRKNVDVIKEKGMHDIVIDNEYFLWNTTKEGWILNKDVIKGKEIGCVHTTQGYDLNYVGVIFGWEIDYDERKNELIIDRNNFYDRGVKTSTDDEELKKYVINAYKVLLTRGIHGCYVYACNEGMRKYLHRFIDC